MKTKDIEPSQYAAWYGCSLQNVTKKLRHNKKLQGVIRVKKFSRFYLLEVAADMDAETFKDMNNSELVKKVKPKK
jgi:hypothetical protein